MIIITTKKCNTKKFRGSRTCGGGTTKNRRGAGNRGGRGRSGENKHHFVRAIQRGYKRGSQRGFSRPLKTLNNVSIVNVGELDELADQLVEDGFAKIENEAYSISLPDLGIDKVLGSGKVTRSMVVFAESFSEIAKEKIENAGGSCIGVE